MTRLSVDTVRASGLGEVDSGSSETMVSDAALPSLGGVSAVENEEEGGMTSSGRDTGAVLLIDGRLSSDASIVCERRARRATDAIGGCSCSAWSCASDMINGGPRPS